MKFLDCGGVQRPPVGRATLGASMFCIFTNANSVTRIAVIDGSHCAADEWALRQSNRTTPQVSSPQGKNLYATPVLAVFEVALLVPG